jgi:hypothetical protein
MLATFVVYQGTTSQPAKTLDSEGVVYQGTTSVVPQGAENERRR